jgi:hypothetical protein
MAQFYAALQRLTTISRLVAAPFARHLADQMGPSSSSSPILKLSEHSFCGFGMLAVLDSQFEQVLGMR